MYNVRKYDFLKLNLECAEVKKMCMHKYDFF